MRGVLPRRTFYVLASVAVLHAGLLCFWYASGTTGPISAASEWSIFVRNYWMFPASALYGFAVGFAVSRSPFMWTVLLMGFLALLGAVMHWAAGRMGLVVDWVAPKASLTGALIVFVMYMPFALVGSILGRKVGPPKLLSRRPAHDGDVPFLLGLRAQTMHRYELAVGIDLSPARNEARVLAHFAIPPGSWNWREAGGVAAGGCKGAGRSGQAICAQIESRAAASRTLGVQTGFRERACISNANGERQTAMKSFTRSLQAVLIVGLAQLLYGCNPIEMLQEQLAHSRAVSASLEKSTGLKSEVGFNWNNGKLVSVNVMFQGMPTNVALPELAEKSKAAVLSEFKENPKQLVISFIVDK